MWVHVPWESVWDDGRKRIILFDTTLRDGHQCPGAAVEDDENYFSIVRWLDGIGIDICEVGFPASSEHEAWRVNRVAQMTRDGEISTIVCWLTQMVDFQVDACIKALEPAAEVWKWFFHIYFPVDPTLRAASIWENVSNDDAIKDVARFTKMAKDAGMIVQFSPEGYSRVWDQFDFCTELFIAAAENGATHFNCPDTIWWEDPNNPDKEYYVATMMRHKAIIDQRFPWNDFVWSVHNHNDFWIAVENSIQGLLPGTGISKWEFAMNSIGERSGNASMEQAIVRMKTVLKRLFDIDHIDASKIMGTSTLVSEHMLPVQPNSPIIWSSAAKHTAWWHAAAILKNPMAYQPFDPEIVWSEVVLVYGPNSGSNLAVSIIEKQWYVCSREEKREVDKFLKARMQETWRYKWITDEELLELYFEFREPIKITDYDKFKIDGSNEVGVIFKWIVFWEEDIELQWETVFTALSDFVKTKIPWYKVGKYSSESGSTGSRSEAVTTIEIIHEESERVIQGIWRDNDTEIALLKALANWFNSIYIEENYKQK